MRIETRIIFSGIASSDVPIWETPHFLCLDNLEIKKASVCNIDTVDQYLSIYVIRATESISIADTNILLNTFKVDAGASIEINLIAGHCLSLNDRLYFKSTVADKLILNISGIAYREDI